MKQNALFQKIPPTVASEGVSRALPLVCRRSYGQARHGGGFGDRQKDSALNWVNRDRRVFAVVVCVSALIDLDAAKTSAFEGGVHLGGFLWCFEVRPDQPEVIRAKLLPGYCAFCGNTNAIAKLDWDAALFPVGKHLLADFQPLRNDSPYTWAIKWVNL